MINRGINLPQKLIVTWTEGGGLEFDLSVIEVIYECCGNICCLFFLGKGVCREKLAICVTFDRLG